MSQSHMQCATTTTTTKAFATTMESTMDIFANPDAWVFQEDGNIIAVPLDNSYKEMARKGKSFAELLVAYMKEQEGYDDYKKYLPTETEEKPIRVMSEPVCSLKGSRRLSEKQAEQKTHKKHSGAFRRSMASRKRSQAKKHRSMYSQRTEVPEVDAFVYAEEEEKCVTPKKVVTPSPPCIEEEEEEYEQRQEDERNFWEMYDMRFAAHFGFDF
jgi:hypothetical protein